MASIGQVLEEIWEYDPTNSHGVVRSSGSDAKSWDSFQVEIKAWDHLTQLYRPKSSNFVAC